jgi:uncharacterized RmlC-like cupin family protein
MEILKLDQAIVSKKDDGTSVVYYIFPEYELHYNEIPGKTIQQWHHHEVLEEAIYIISGALEFHWIENEAKRSKILNAGDIVRVENEPHTLENKASSPATFLVVRLVLSGTDKRSLFRTDKVIDRVD